MDNTAEQQTTSRPIDKRKRSVAEELQAEIRALEERFKVVVVTDVPELERAFEQVLQLKTHLIRGAAYIRYSSVAQMESFSLDAQLRQIIDHAKRDGVEIVIVFADPAQSAYHKHDRPAINALTAGARKRLFQRLYVHKIDRLARRIEWFIEIVQELDRCDVRVLITEQNVNLYSPEGKFVAHLLGVFAQYYSENLSLETGKGKHEASLQGYHNGAKPLGYVSSDTGKHKVGVIHPEIGPVVAELFERYSSGLYSDRQLMEWLAKQPAMVDNGLSLTKDGVRELLQNPYYIGKVRYRGQKVREKDMPFRSTPGLLSPGKHPPLISEELFKRCQEIRSARARTSAIRQKTARTHLLQGIAFCFVCGCRLWVQTPKSCPSYYREPSNLRTGRNCPNGGRGVRAKIIEDQIAELVKSLHLPTDWEEIIRSMLADETKGADPEMEKREIRSQLRRLRENFELGQYDGEEYVYRQKVDALQQKLNLLLRAPDSNISKAAQSLLAMSETWDWATREEQQQLMRMMFAWVSCDVVNQRITWVRPRPDFDILFRVAKNLKPDEQGRYWLTPEDMEADD